MGSTPSDDAQNGHMAGLDLTGRDTAVRPQDDFFRHWNGQWLDTFDIPADKAEYNSFTGLHDTAQEQLKAIIEEVSQAGQPEPRDPGNADADVAFKIATLYRDFLDTERLIQLGLSPLADVFADIDGIDSIDKLPTVFGRLDRLGIGGPIQTYVHQDNHDSTRYLLDVRQSGICLPDRDYYLEKKHRPALHSYREHVAKMWVLAGFGDDEAAGEVADQIVGLETKLAEIQWDSVRNRDPHETYNLHSVSDFVKLAPALSPSSFLAEIGADGRVDDVNIGQPDYVSSLSTLVQESELQDWRALLRWRVLATATPLLAPDLDDANFVFFGGVLRGIPEQRPRWKRGVELVQSALGEALGQLYVQRHFQPEKKARMVALVNNLLAAYAQAIDELAWMTPATKARAHDKLATFRAKIGYPDVWRDYSRLEIVPGDLVGNVLRSQAFEHDRDIAKLGGPIDREEWFMPPQMVNAYYNPEMNEIVFPAAILQPPFFDNDADDAVNYGAIGAVIGHEISHGFDDKGSHYDGQGNLVDWWTNEDREAFGAKTSDLVAQYSMYEPVAGHNLNGELTLGENIADVSGLAVALRAYRHGLGETDPPVIDGLTGVQRFFASYAQVWRAKTREEEQVRRVATDPHSPPRYRVMGVLANSDDFAEAFDVGPADGMWREPRQRVTIW